jgi:hypothetical protein
VYRVADIRIPSRYDRDAVIAASEAYRASLSPASGLGSGTAAGLARVYADSEAARQGEPVTRVGFAQDPATADLRNAVIAKLDKDQDGGAFVGAVAERRWEDALAYADSANRARFHAIMAWRMALRRGAQARRAAGTLGPLDTRDYDGIEDARATEPGPLDARDYTPGDAHAPYVAEPCSDCSPPNADLSMGEPCYRHGGPA